MTSNLSRRLKQRAGWLAGVGGLHLIGPALALACSLVVLQTIGTEMWGTLVHGMVICGLAAHVVGWGNRDFMLREMAAHPGQMVPLWRRNTLSRHCLLLPVAGIVFALLGPTGQIGLAIPLLWIFATSAARSFDSLLVQTRRFRAVLAVDLTAAAGQIAALYLLCTTRTPDVTSLIAVFAVAEAARAIGRAGVFRFVFNAPGGGWSVHPRELSTSLGFFFLGLSGLLASRSDTYVVSQILPASTLGSYQVLVSLITTAQMAGSILLMTLTPSLLRMPRAVIYRLLWRMAGLGGLVMMALALVLPWALPAVFTITLPLSLTILACATGILPFISGPLFLLAHRQHKEMQVAASGLSAALLITCGTLLLAPHLGLAGAQIAVALGHGLQVLWLMRIQERKPVNA